MKILIIGQCQGGNAKSWQEFLSNYTELDLVHYVCRNHCQADFNLHSKNQKVFRIYNAFKGLGLLEKIWIKLMSSYLLPILIKILDKYYTYDIVHFQGNYEPKFNISIMKSTRAKSVIQIYGSDFYQRYLNGSESSKNDFEAAIKLCNHVLFNHGVLKNDFLTKIDCSLKVSVGCMGASDLWSTNSKIENNSKDNITRLLSARGMYTYNNVDLLVDSFIEYYANNPNFELYIINGYGWDEPEKSIILRKIDGIPNIISEVGKWISDEELRDYYDLCDYNFCIGSTDQLSVSIMYGYLRGCLNILSPLRNYSELETLNFRSHVYLNDITAESMNNIVKELPEIDQVILLNDFENAKENFLFRNSFKNTLDTYKSLIKLNNKV